MPAPLLLIDTDAATQAAADVVVIGAGIVGACAAYYYLARRGVKVALVERPDRRGTMCGNRTRT